MRILAADVECLIDRPRSSTAKVVPQLVGNLITDKNGLAYSNCTKVAVGRVFGTISSISRNYSRINVEILEMIGMIIQAAAQMQVKPACNQLKSIRGSNGSGSFDS